MRMNWDALISDHRYSTGTGRKPPIDRSAVKVNAFQEDGERIIYSSAFRRLQGKTQVQPLPKVDYVRTRLTHTLEVASAARLISNLVGRYIVQSDGTTDWGGMAFDSVGTIIDICVAASLGHDLGNPPFGHIGEYAIQSYFSEKASSSKAVFDFLKDPKRKFDFTSFDGNAQGFRILTRLQGWRGRGGLQLSYSVMGAFSKYPCSSIVGRLKYGKDKFGFMQNDRSAAAEIFRRLGMPEIAVTGLGGLGNEQVEVLVKQGAAIEFARHPLAWIVEAADDISYRTTDIEDAFRYGAISFGEAEDILRPIAESRGHLPRYADISLEAKEDRIAYLRAGAVSALIEACAESFISSYDLIMEGKNETPLVMKTSFKEKMEEIREISFDKIYVQRDKMEVEAAGCHVILGLLSDFGDMIVEYMEKKDPGKLTMRSRALFNLLPFEFRRRLEPGDGYESFLVLTDYISGMTDDYALELYQKISGVSVSLGRML